MRINRRLGVLSRLRRLPWEQVVAQARRQGVTLVGVCVLALLFLLPPASPFTIARVLGILAVSIAGVGMMRVHYSEWHLSQWLRPKVKLLLWIAALLSVGGVQLGRLLLEGRAMDPHLGYLTAAPIAAGAILIGALLSPTAAASFTTLISLGCAVTGVCELRFIAAAWVAGVVGSHAVNPLRQRSDLLRAGEIVLLIYAGAAAAIGAMDGHAWRSIGLAAGWAILGAVGAMAIFWLAVAVLERHFGVLTDWGLLELSSPEHPLLRELCTLAPGTYQHSIMVANLAESAAKAIGANPLLTRVCAYFHDIGKLQRADFFIENQNIANVHDRLAPSLSAMIITAHVKDGIELAEEHRLPQPIKDAVAQHHGTSLITYFYYQAKSCCEQEDPGLEMRFRYPGPKPQSKEAALIMLADTTEAATRTMGRLSPSRLEHYISQLVEERRSDGQLDESELTFRDLRRIVEAFVHTLTASRHLRIEYPTEVNADEAVVAADSSRDLQPVGP